MLLVTNIVIALTLLLRGLFLDNSVRLYSFPAILVLTTLFRLGLNVASVRLILLYGEQGTQAAGQVIRAFGELVVQDNFIVGAIVFAIIAVVNFLVIAKGAARVAEVSARFSLDALPGRQLSIDSDLRAGTITKEQAAHLREDLDKQSQFFGSMDGAMKWVQGDAIAGLVIALINSIGGISIGVAGGLSFANAVQNFGILTIGDGLVSILPSLLISVTAGIIVTQAAGTSAGKQSSNDQGGQIVSQLLGDPRAAMLAGLVMVAVSFFGVALLLFTDAKGFPVIPFFVIGAGMLVFLGGSTWMREERELQKLTGEPSARVVSGSRALPGGVPAGLLPPVVQTADNPFAVRALAVEVDRTLAPYFGIRQDGGQDFDAAGYREFNAYLAQWRDSLFRERGIVLPDAAIAIGKNLPTGGYRVYVRERFARADSLSLEQAAVLGSQSIVTALGFEVVRTAPHPVDRKVITWVSGNRAAFRALQHLGTEVCSPAQFLALETAGAALEVIDELLGVDEIKHLLNGIREQHAGLLAEVFDTRLLSYGEFTELLRRLVRERVSIRDLKLILEGAAEFAALKPPGEQRAAWLGELHSFIRVVLSRGIISAALGPGDRLRTFTLSGTVEEEFREAVDSWDYARSRLPLDPTFEAALRASSSKLFNPVLERGALPVVILCSAEIRQAVQEFFSRQLATADWCRTIAYQELDGQYQPESIGVLDVSS